MKHIIAIAAGYAIGTVCGLIGSQASSSKAARFDDDVKAMMREEPTAENRAEIVDLMKKSQDYHVAAAVALSACASVGAFIGAVVSVFLTGSKPRWVQEMENGGQDPQAHRRRRRRSGGAKEQAD